MRNIRKRYTLLWRLCILQLCLLCGFLLNIRTVRADLLLDTVLIDGSHNIYFDQQPLREIQYNGTVVWRAGADITYAIDNNITETHFVPYGQTTLGIAGSKVGYEFVGWRADVTASGDVLTTDLCTGDEKTLYAVFRRPVTVNFYNGSPTNQVSVGHIYYNNGNTRNPEFTIPQTPLSGWTARGWAGSQAADAGVSYPGLDHTVITSDITLYGAYQKTITASFDGNGAESGSVPALTGTAYYNSAGNTLNPAFQMPGNGFSRTGHTWSGWLQGSTGIARMAGESVTLSADTIFAAQWTRVYNFSYTGYVQTWKVPVTGYYNIEAWGASGGTAYGEASANGVPEENVRGGNGGYASGYKYLTSGTTLYICVGGAGENWNAGDPQTQGGRGGYNGGAAGLQNDHVDGVSGEGHHIREGGGGGATHVSAWPVLLGNHGPDTRPDLTGGDHQDHTSDILLVAGGGGGGRDNYEPNENGIGDEIYGSPGGAGGSDISPDNAAAFLKGQEEGAGGGYYTGGRGSGGSNYIGGVLPTLTYNGHVYTSTSSTSSHRGNGTVTITYLGN